MRTALTLAWLMCVAVVAHADPISREAALHRLIARVDMPMSTEVMTRLMGDLRRTVPAAYVDGAGRGAQLGERWKPGNPQWDKAHAVIEEAVAHEERVGGPVFVVTGLDVERALDVPWSEDDIDFLVSSLDTSLGRAMLQLLDAAVVSGFATSAAQQPNIPAESADAFRAMSDQARSSFVEAVERVNGLTPQDPERARRLEALVSIQDPTRARSIGTALLAPSMKRFAGIGSAVSPQVERIIGEFRSAP